MPVDLETLVWNKINLETLIKTHFLFPTFFQLQKVVSRFIFVFTFNNRVPKLILLLSFFLFHVSKLTITKNRGILEIYPKYGP